MTSHTTVIIASGGTGGHVMPSLAVAEILSERDWDIHWVGTPDGIENKLVTKAGYPLYALTITGLRGKGHWARFKSLLHLIQAIFKSLLILYQVKPSAVLGMGGYASAPCSIAALIARVPLILHEQNSVTGMTNRWLNRFAHQTLCAFPNTFKKPKKSVKVVGNPIRASIRQLPCPRLRREKRNPVSLSKRRILILGGSQGAQRINETLPEVMHLLTQAGALSIWHQTGNKDLETVRQHYQKLGLSAKVEPFIDPLAQAYHWADLVICRSGAMTVSELCAAGLPSILIPFPQAADNHQLHNANFLTQAGCAHLVLQAELKPEHLTKRLMPFIQSPKTLFAMADKAYHIGQLHRQAAVVTADIFETLR